MNIYEKLSMIQNELKVPKGQYNSFGKYKFRSCEDILEAVKPICHKNKTTLVLSDSIEMLGYRVYIVAKAILFDQESNEKIENTAYAREAEEKKGMDDSQVTGTASSYARKYALNGLFNIDDTKDADTDEYVERQVINDTKAQALKKAITNNHIEDKKVDEVLESYGYAEIEEILMRDYKNICDALKEIGGSN